MNTSASPSPAATRFSPPRSAACFAAGFAANSAAYSSVRTVVVPTATTRRLRWNLVPLPMQLVIFHFFYSYRLKRAQSDVQCDLGNFNPASTNLLQDL